MIRSRAPEEIITRRTFGLPRAELFHAFADPELLAQWWGPGGSVSTFHEFDFRKGGRWQFVMRAADGTEYSMMNEFVEVQPPACIVVRHVQAGHGFRLTMTYAELDAGRTELTWRMLFDSAAEAQRVREFVADANEQNFDRLASLLGEVRR